MAGSVNKVILIGNLGRDPETKTMPSGDIMVTLSVATSETWKNKDGDRQERTEWHRVVIWNQGIAKVADRYLEKGAKVYIEGQLETRKWTDQASGQERYSTEVVLRPFNGSLTMLSSMGTRSSGDDGNDNYMPPPAGERQAQQPYEMTEMEDEIPF